MQKGEEEVVKKVNRVTYLDSPDTTLLLGVSLSESLLMLPEDSDLFIDQLEAIPELIIDITYSGGLTLYYMSMIAAEFANKFTELDIFLIRT